MLRSTLAKAILSILILSSGVACNYSVTPPPSETDPSPATTQINSNNLCANPLYPVVQGATWSYSSTGMSGITQAYTFTDTVTSVRPDGFTLTSQFAQAARTQEWSCKPEGLVALQLGSGPAGILTNNQMVVDVTTSNATGVTIPSSVTAGQTWNYALDLAGTAQVSGVSADAEGSASSSFEAQGTENVTVPAGSFAAQKILVTTTFDVQGTYQGLTLPITFTVTSTVWFAPGVGWVKMENGGSWQGTQFAETLSLQSYNVP